MGYLHIDNLYKNTDILNFREAYALEKIHGTSAHIGWKYCEDSHATQLKYFSGGEKYEKFVKLFDNQALLQKFEELFPTTSVTIYGEAYGGKCQGMKDIYGKNLKFIVFDVKIGKNWLAVPQAEEIVKNLGLEFVHYVKIPMELGFIDGERDSDSVQAIRNGLGKGKKREGVVLRPLIEVIKNNGERIIVKHKREDFRETKSKRKVTDPEKLKILTKAKEISEEWVTPMRLNHILDKIEDPCLQKMREIIISMQEDIKREAKGEILWNKHTEKAIGRKTAYMTKEYFQNKLKEEKQ